MRVGVQVTLSLLRMGCERTERTCEGSAMGLLDGLMGNASEIEPERIEEEFGRVMAPGERIEKAYLLIRDLFVFTNKWLILVDKQGRRGTRSSIIHCSIGASLTLA